jgi:surface polysaccharide O-acyltransferase-like enzyme
MSTSTATDTPNLIGEGLGQRRFDLDWVRILAFMLLIGYHVGMYYVTWDWQVKSAHASTAIEPLMMLSSPWRLSLLFLVSGVATAYLLARQGTQGFLGSRSFRLLIPLVVGMAFIVPPQSYDEVVEKLHYSGSFVDFWRLYITGYHGFCRDTECLVLPTWNHLWFVAYLWVYTVVLYAVVRLAPQVTPALRRFAERRFAGIGVLLWPLVYLCSIRMVLSPRFPANHALAGDWYNHALYFGIFVLGYTLAGTRSAWPALERLRWPSLGVAVLAWAVLCGYLGAYSDPNDSPSESLMNVMRSVYGVEQWLSIAAVLGFASRHLRRDNPARRYLTTAIFPVYILHQTVIIVAAHALKPADLYPPVEALMLVLVTIAVCFLSYEVIRRIPLMRPLFGLGREAKERSVAPPIITDRWSSAQQFGVPTDIH